MLTAAGQAFQELFTPPFRAVLIKCVGFTIGLLVALIVGIECLQSAISRQDFPILTGAFCCSYRVAHRDRDPP